MNRFHAADEFKTEGGFLDPELLTQSAPLMALRDHWRAVRGTRLMPAHADLKPAGMKAALPFLSIYEAVDGGNEFRIRLVGTAIVGAAGVDETGKLLSESVHTHLAQRTRAVCRYVMRRRAGIRGVAPVTLSDAVDVLAYEGMWLPLARDGETPDMVAACIVFATMDRLRLEAAIKPMADA